MIEAIQPNGPAQPLQDKTKSAQAGPATLEPPIAASTDSGSNADISSVRLSIAHSHQYLREFIRQFPQLKNTQEVNEALEESDRRYIAFIERNAVDYQSAIRNITPRIMANVLLDKAMKDSHYEGSEMADHLNITIQALNRYKHTLSKIAHPHIHKRLSKWITSLQQAAIFQEQFKNNVAQNRGSGNPYIDPSILHNIQRRISSLNAGDTTVFPSGFLACGESHSMLLEVKKNTNNTLCIRFFNTGSGAEFHESLGSAKGKKIMAAYTIDRIQSEAFQNKDVLRTLFEPVCIMPETEAQNFSQNHLYIRAVSALSVYGAKVIDHYDGEGYLGVAHQQNLKAILPGRAGTCTQKSIHAYLRCIAEEAGHLEDYKVAKLYIQKETLKGAVKTLLIDQTADDVEMSDLLALREAIDIFSRSVYKLYTATKNDTLLKETLPLLVDSKNRVLHALEVKHAKNEEHYEKIAEEERILENSRFSRVIRSKKRPQSRDVDLSEILVAVPHLPLPTFTPTEPVESLKYLNNFIDPFERQKLSDRNIKRLLLSFIAQIPVPKVDQNGIWATIDQHEAEEMLIIVSGLCQKLFTLFEAEKSDPEKAARPDKPELLTAYGRLLTNALAIAKQSEEMPCRWLNEVFRLPNLVEQFKPFFPIENNEDRETLRQIDHYLEHQLSPITIFDEMAVRQMPQKGTFNEVSDIENGFLNRLLREIPNLKYEVFEGVKQNIKINREILKGSNRLGQFTDLMLLEYDIKDCHLRAELYQNMGHYLKHYYPVFTQLRNVTLMGQLLLPPQSVSTKKCLESLLKNDRHYEAFKGSDYLNLKDKLMKVSSCKRYPLLEIKESEWTPKNKLPGLTGEIKGLEHFNTLRWAREILLGDFPEELKGLVNDFLNISKAQWHPYHNVALSIYGHESIETVITNEATRIANVIDYFSNNAFDKLVQQKAYQDLFKLLVFSGDALEGMLKNSPCILQKLHGLIMKGFSKSAAASDWRSHYFFLDFTLNIQSIIRKIPSQLWDDHSRFLVTSILDLLPARHFRNNQFTSDKSAHQVDKAAALVNLYAKQDLMTNEDVSMMIVQGFEAVFLANQDNKNHDETINQMIDNMWRHIHAFRSVLQLGMYGIVERVLRELGIKYMVEDLKRCRVAENGLGIIMNEYYLDLYEMAVLVNGIPINSIPKQIKESKDYAAVFKQNNKLFRYNKDQYYFESIESEPKYRFYFMENEWRLYRLFNDTWARLDRPEDPNIINLAKPLQTQRNLWSSIQEDKVFLSNEDEILCEVWEASAEDRSQGHIVNVENPKLHLLSTGEINAYFPTLDTVEDLSEVLLWKNKDHIQGSELHLPRYQLKFVAQFNDKTQTVRWMLLPKEKEVFLADNQCHPLFPYFKGALILENDMEEKEVIVPVSVLNQMPFEAESSVYIEAGYLLKTETKHHRYLHYKIVEKTDKAEPYGYMEAIEKTRLHCLYAMAIAASAGNYDQAFQYLGEAHAGDPLSTDEKIVLFNFCKYGKMYPVELALVLKVACRFLKTDPYWAKSIVEVNFYSYKNRQANVPQKFRLTAVEDDEVKQFLERNAVGFHLTAIRDGENKQYRQLNAQYQSTCRPDQIDTLLLPDEKDSLFDSDLYNQSIILADGHVVNPGQIIDKIAKDTLRRPLDMAADTQSMSFNQTSILDVFDDFLTREKNASSDTEYKGLTVRLLKYFSLSLTDEKKVILLRDPTVMKSPQLRASSKLRLEWLAYLFLKRLFSGVKTKTMDQIKNLSDLVHCLQDPEKCKPFLEEVSSSDHSSKKRVFRLAVIEKKDEPFQQIRSTGPVETDISQLNKIDDFELMLRKEIVESLPAKVETPITLNEFALEARADRLDASSKARWKYLVETLKNCKRKDKKPALSRKVSDDFNLARAGELRIKLEHNCRLFERKEDQIRQALFKLINTLPEKNAEEKKALLRSVYIEEEHNSLSDILVDFFNQDLEALKARYPSLAANPKVAQLFWQQIKMYLQVVTSRRHLERIAETFLKIENAYLKEEESKCQAIVNELLEEARGLLEKDRAYPWETSQEELVLEYYLGFRLNRNQVQAVNDFLKSEEDPSRLNNLVKNLIMGSGKSSVIHVLLALKLAKNTERPVILHMPEGQLSSNESYLFSLLTQKLNRPVMTFKFNRCNKVDRNSLEDGYKELLRCMKNNGIILATPQSVQCVFLKLHEAFLAAKKARKNKDEEAEKLAVFSMQGLLKILRFLKKGVAIFDEAHLLFDSLTELTFPYGNAKHLSRLHIDMLNTLLLDLNRSYCGNLPSILSPSDKEDLVEKQIERLKGSGLDPDNLLPPVEYFLNRYDWTPRGQESADLLKAIKLLRLFMLQILPFTLSKVANRDFGLDPKRPEHDCPVPLLAAKQPKENAEFAHPDVLVALTWQYYLDQGLTLDQFKRLITFLKKEDLHNKADMAQRNLIIYITTPLNLQSIAQLNVDNAIEIEDYYEILKSHAAYKDVVSGFVQTMVLPQITFYPEFLSATAFDLQSVLYKKVLGDTGSFDNRTWSAQMSGSADQETDAQVFQSILAHSVGNIVLAPPEQITVIEQISHNPDFKACRAIIDAGALFKDEDTHTIAKMIIENNRVIPIKGVRFFNKKDNNRLWVMMKKNGEWIEKRASEVDCSQADEWITYYDHANITGADVEQATLAVAYVTVGRKMTDTDAFQACMRMRKLAKGQRIKWVITQDIADELETLSTESILTWAIKNKEKDLEDTLVMAIEAQYEALPRQAFYAMLMSDNGDTHLFDGRKTHLNDAIIRLYESVFVSKRNFEDPDDFRERTLDRNTYIDAQEKHCEALFRTLGLDNYSEMYILLIRLREKAQAVLPPRISLLTARLNLGTMAQIEAEDDTIERYNLASTQEQKAEQNQNAEKPVHTVHPAYMGNYTWQILPPAHPFAALFARAIDQQFYISKDLLEVFQDPDDVQLNARDQHAIQTYAKKKCRYYLSGEINGEETIVLLSDLDVEGLMLGKNKIKDLLSFEIRCVSDGQCLFKTGTPLKKNKVTDEKDSLARFLIALSNGEWPNFRNREDEYYFADYLLKMKGHKIDGSVEEILREIWDLWGNGLQLNEEINRFSKERYRLR